MATIIRIKRSTSASAPGSLKSGELSYSAGTGTQANGGDRLYFGKGDDGSGNATTIEVIGGAFFANMLDHVAGTLTASSAIVVDASSKIDVLNVDNITIDGNTISSTNTDGNIVLDPNGAGFINASTSLISNVTDPSSAQDAATKAYVDNASATKTIEIQTDSGQARTINLADSDLIIHGGTQIGTRRAGTTVTIELDPTGVATGTYGSATQIPVFTVNSQGTLDSAGSVPVATDLAIAGDGGTDTVSILTDTLTFQGSTNITTAVTDNQVAIILDSDVTGLSSLTVDNLKMDGNTLSSTDASGYLYINPYPVGDSGNLVILGNLVVEGTTTTINSVELTVNDKLITLADSASDSAAANGAGISVEGANASIIYNSVTDTWDLNKPLGSIRNHLVNFTTDNLSEGSTNLYYTDERVDDRLSNLLLAGEAIDLTYDDASNTLQVDVEVATVTNRGAANFDSDQMTVTAGLVSIFDLDGGTY